MTNQTRPKMGQLQPGQQVLLGFKGSDEVAWFVAMEGEGESRRIKFLQNGPDGKPFDWEAYRYEGHWAYGTSADRLVLRQVLTMSAATEAAYRDDPVLAAEGKPEQAEIAAAVKQGRVAGLATAAAMIAEILDENPEGGHVVTLDRIRGFVEEFSL